MRKPALRIRRSEGVEHGAERGFQRLCRACAQAAQECLQLAPRLLDGIQGRRVGRQEEEPTAGALDQLAYPPGAVRGECCPG